MSTAPIDIPVRIKGLSDLQKLERRMEALEKELEGVSKDLTVANKKLEKLGRTASKAAKGVKGLGKSFGLLKGVIVGAALGFAGKQLIGVAVASIKATGEITKLEAAFASLTGSTVVAVDPVLILGNLYLVCSSV